MLGSNTPDIFLWAVIFNSQPWHERTSSSQTWLYSAEFSKNFTIDRSYVIQFQKHQVKPNSPSVLTLGFLRASNMLSCILDWWEAELS